MNVTYETVNIKRRNEYIKAALPIGFLLLAVSAFSFYLSLTFVLNGQIVETFWEANNLALYGTLLWIGFLTCLVNTFLIFYAVYRVNKSHSTPNLNKFEPWLRKSVYGLLFSLPLILIGLYGLN